MSDIIYYIIALGIGFMHAFEADHLAAVSSLVSKHKSIKESIKDGIYWGVGHTLIIIIIGILIIGLKYSVPGDIFKYFEMVVAIMLIGLGVYRLYQLYALEQRDAHFEGVQLALVIGMVHGLAGSGAVVLSVLIEVPTVVSGFIYLLCFGIGSIFGMLLAAYLMKKLIAFNISNVIQTDKIFTIISSIFCIGYGIYLLIELT